MNERYAFAKETYASIGVDTEAALEKLANASVSMHCWQGDDISGFDTEGGASGGIAATGNYPGKARNAEELMADIEKAEELHLRKVIVGKAIYENRITLKDIEQWLLNV